MKYVSGLGMGRFEFKSTRRPDSTRAMPYADISEFYGAQEIGGAIFETKIDTTHPLLYGYYRDRLPVFRNSELFMAKSNKSFANPVVYTNSPLLSGYISDINLDQLKGTPVVGVTTYGKGKVIGFTDNLNFRAFWYGTNKLFMNAIFFGRTLDSFSSR